MKQLLLIPILLSLVSATVALAQPIGAGVKGGWIPTDWTGIPSTRPAFDDRSGHYTVGPYVEVRLPFSLAVEVDALYRPYGYRSADGIAGIVTSSTVDARSWEFPVLGKYRIPLQVLSVKPFVLAGVTFRNVGTIHTVSTCAGNLCGSNEGTQSFTRDGFTKAGFVAGGGLEWKAGPLRLAAEGRYTRIGDLEHGRWFTVDTTRQNQAALLFSIGF